MVIHSCFCIFIHSNLITDSLLVSVGGYGKKSAFCIYAGGDFEPDIKSKFIKAGRPAREGGPLVNQSELKCVTQIPKPPHIHVWGFRYLKYSRYSSIPDIPYWSPFKPAGAQVCNSVSQVLQPRLPTSMYGALDILNIPLWSPSLTRV